jgi:hypothetical protein
MQHPPARIDASTPLAEAIDPASVGFLSEHLARLHSLYDHGNRELHYDQLLLALLLSFFNPVIRSLRLIQGCGDFDGRLDIDRLARTTTSNALALFDPVHLLPIIKDLQQKAGLLKRADDGLCGFVRRIIAADGTYLTTFADVAWALHHRRRNGTTQAQVRLNVQLDTGGWTPQVLSVSGDDGSESSAFAPDLLSDVLYVLDRNFLDFAFLQQLLEKNNDFVLRVRDNAPAVKVVADRPITPKDAEAGVISDQTVELTGRDAPGGLFRLVCISVVNRAGKREIIRLLSSLGEVEISAEVIGQIYQQRWQIELFFKWLKTWAAMDHLLSTSRNGITFQFYVAVIGVLLMYVHLGRRVSRYAIVSLQLLMHGQISLEQMMRYLAQMEREKELARVRAAKRRARKKLA